MEAAFFYSVSLQFNNIFEFVETEWKARTANNKQITAAQHPFDFLMVVSEQENVKSLFDPEIVIGSLFQGVHRRLINTLFLNLGK